MRAQRMAAHENFIRSILRDVKYWQIIGAIHEIERLMVSCTMARIGLKFDIGSRTAMDILLDDNIITPERKEFVKKLQDVLSKTSVSR